MSFLYLNWSLIHSKPLVLTTEKDFSRLNHESAQWIILLTNSIDY